MDLCNELHQLGPLWIFMEVSLTLHNYLLAPGLSEMNVTHPSAETKWPFGFQLGWTCLKGLTAPIRMNQFSS